MPGFCVSPGKVTCRPIAVDAKTRKGIDAAAGDCARQMFEGPLPVQTRSGTVSCGATRTVAAGVLVTKFRATGKVPPIKAEVDGSTSYWSLVLR